MLKRLGPIALIVALLSGVGLADAQDGNLPQPQYANAEETRNSDGYFHSANSAPQEHANPGEFETYRVPEQDPADANAERVAALPYDAGSGFEGSLPLNPVNDSLIDHLPNMVPTPPQTPDVIHSEPGEFDQYGDSNQAVGLYDSLSMQSDGFQDPVVPSQDIWGKSSYAEHHGLPQSINYPRRRPAVGPGFYSNGAGSHDPYTPEPIAQSLGGSSAVDIKNKFPTPTFSPGLDGNCAAGSPNTDGSCAATAPMVVGGSAPVGGDACNQNGGSSSCGGGYGNARNQLFGDVFGTPTNCPRLYGGAEFIYWYTRGMNVPALVTASSDSATPVEEAGVLGYPNTQTIFGGRRLATNDTGGFRFFAGINLDCCGCNRIQADFFNLGEDSFGFNGNAPREYDIIARPFFNAFTAAYDSELIGYPGLVYGDVSVRGTTDFQGYGVNFRHNLLCHRRFRECANQSCCECGNCTCDGTCEAANVIGSALANARAWRLRSLEAVFGWRHLDLDESLQIREELTAIDPAGLVPYGTTLDITDQFTTTNRFDGFNIGLAWQWQRCNRWGLSMRALAAIGQNRQTATINGSTVITEPGAAPLIYSGGLLALDSNIGTYERTTNVVIPEFGFDMHYNICRGVRMTLGYTLIYWDSVLRPGGIIDDTIDPRLLPPVITPNSGRPEYVAREDNFWAQGLRFGLEVQF